MCTGSPLDCELLVGGSLAHFSLCSQGLGEDQIQRRGCES